MKTLDEFEIFFNESLADVARVVERRRDAVAPHYKRYYWKLLIISAITLTAEIAYHNIQNTETLVLNTPMIAVALFIFGSIAIGMRQNSRTRKFIRFFDDKITVLLSKVFFSEWVFNPETKDLGEELRDCVQFDKLSIQDIEGRCFLTKGDMTLLNLTIKSSVDSISGEDNRGRTSTKEGLFFTKTCSAHSKERWLLMPDLMEGKFGKGATKTMESAIQMLKTFEHGMMPGRREIKGGDATYGKEIVRFDNDDTFEKVFRVYKDKGSAAPGFLNKEIRAKLVNLAQGFDFPFSLSISKGKLCFYLPSGAFFSCDELDVFKDISGFDYYRRFYENAQQAYSVVAALSNDDIQMRSVPIDF